MYFWKEFLVRILIFSSLCLPTAYYFRHFMLQANKLPQQSFMDAGRRRDTPGSDMKHYYSRKWKQSECQHFIISVPNCYSHKASQSGLDDTRTHPVLCYKKITLSFKNLNVLYKSRSTLLFCSGRRHLYFPRWLCKHA